MNRPVTDLKKGSEILVNYLDGRKPEWFKYLGIQGNVKEMKKTGGKHGFIIIGEPIKETRCIIKDGKVVPVALFPETIKSIESDDKNLREED